MGNCCYHDQDELRKLISVSFSVRFLLLSCHLRYHNVNAAPTPVDAAIPTARVVGIPAIFEIIPAPPATTPTKVTSFCIGRLRLPIQVSIREFTLPGSLCEFGVKVVCVVTPSLVKLSLIIVPSLLARMRMYSSVSLCSDSVSLFVDRLKLYTQPPLSTTTK